MDKIGKNKIILENYINNIGNSRLEFIIEGDNINYIIVSTIRRIIFECIPIFAFSKINFEKNSSVFHNNYMKLRISNMPVWNIENNIDYFDATNHTVPEQVDIIDDDDDINLLGDSKVDVSSMNQMTMYLNYKNKTNTITTVTTDNAIFYYNSKQIESPYDVPIPLIKLQQNQEIILSAITQLGIENNDVIYSPVSIVTYKEITDNKYMFILESRGQLTEQRILLVAILNIIRKIESFHTTFKSSLSNVEENKSDEKIKIGQLIINEEDHTFGNLITRGLQDHKEILFAGYKMEHPLVSTIIITYKINKNSKISKIIEDVVTYYIELFSSIKSKIEKLKL